MSHSRGLVGCVSSLGLKDRASDAEYVFTETAEAGFCLGRVIRVRLNTPEELQVEVYFDPQPSPTARPNRSGLLKRKQ